MLLKDNSGLKQKNAKSRRKIVMDIIIAGGGKVGRALCRDLSLSDNNVTMIEISENVLEQTINKADINGLVGNAADYDIQVEAGVPQCDIFIAVTPHDEVNIVASSIAKNLGAKYTIARVRTPEYAQHSEFMRQSMGITMMINPEFETATQIAATLRYPEALSVEYFSESGVNIVEVVADSEQLSNQPVNEFRRQFPNILICAIKREDDVMIPNGETIILPGDHLYVTGRQKRLFHFYNSSGLKKSRLKSTLIIGGGRISQYLIHMLEDMNINIKVIEYKEQIAELLSEMFPQIVVIEGNGSDQDFLREERIEQFDSLVSLTGMDEENLLISLFALKQNISKIITKINRKDLISLIEDHSSQAFVTPHQLISNKIMKFVRSINSATNLDIEALYRIADNRIEIIQFHIIQPSKITADTLENLNFAPNILISSITRDKEIIFPTGNDQLQVGDRVIIVTTKKGVTSIDDILA